MAVRSKSEILEVISKITDEAAKTGLMEDVSDSWKDAPDYESADNPYKEKFADMERRYRERFLNGGGPKGDISQAPSGAEINNESSINESVYKQEEEKVTIDSLFSAVDYRSRPN